jgi:hypothetical protein
VQPVKRSDFLSTLLLLIAALAATGCTMGTVARVYATSGNDIALTRYDEAAKAAGPCIKFKESSYMVEVAGGGKGPASDTTCVSFEIHENLAFSAAENLDIQEFLREEFGSGYQFGSVSVRIKIGFFNWLLNLFTLGVANSQTIVITGDRYPMGAAPSE